MDRHGLVTRARGAPVPVWAVDRTTLPKLAQRFDPYARRWLEALEYRGDPGQSCLVPDAGGGLGAVLIGVPRADDLYALSALPYALPDGVYRLEAGELALDAARAALGWGLGAYRFSRYRKAARPPARLLVAPALQTRLEPVLAAVTQVRDLVNTPTEDLGPAELAEAVRTLAREHGARYREWVGPALLRANFPTIHAVGRASHRAPRLIELTIGRDRDPHLVLIGKGVCFDTGGLDLKTSDGMRWMKKDMGGAAHAIALAGLLLRADLPLRLTLLVPAVENVIGANAYRPGEVIRTRAGITVEVDNTDAEGRLILCDAIAYAVEQEPDLIIDIATLTGAARVALGPELPALFTNREDLAEAVLAEGVREHDPLWRLPLWSSYLSLLESRVAEIGNAGSSRMAGAITAALFLQRFVPPRQAWLHLDVYAWNDSDRPGRPAGGEAQGLRALYALLGTRYARRGRRTG